MVHYLNAAAAGPDWEIGWRHDPETHLIPRAPMAAAGRIPSLELFGDGHPTSAWTRIRDFIHEADLARGHGLVLGWLERGGASITLDPGTRTGTSIREILGKIAQLTGRPGHVVNGPRREGDPPVIWANASRARELLNFVPLCSDIDTIIRSAWNFLPHGAGRQ
jgi:UDP-arabinose 4-epimerase